MPLYHLQDWIGRRQTQFDTVSPAPLVGWAATLDRDEPTPRPGEALPPAAHWLYFLPSHRQSELGPDGHAKRGGFLPPVPLPKRMWAGGRLWFHQPIVVGDMIRRESEIINVAVKQGKTGPLVFVLVRHQVFASGEIALTEEHDIVYRDGTAVVKQPHAAPSGALWSRRIHPDPVLLFRYSALTFNGHRIHYDRHYVTQAEGYPGLVVHGPLVATLLMDLYTRSQPMPMTRFSFRAVSPLFDSQPFTINGQPEGKKAELWAANDRGELAMTAEAEFA